MTVSVPAEESARDAEIGGAPPTDDPVLLVARIAELLPGLAAEELERLATALDELTEAVGLQLEVEDDE